MSISNRYIAYIRERFPVLAALAYALLFSLSCAAYVGLGVRLIPGLVLTLAVFLFLFRLRLFDEIKDHAYDSEFHPERPVARGLVSLWQVKKMAAIVLVLELATQYFAGASGLLAYLFLLLYSVLIYKDFFVREILKKSLVLELFVHEMVFVGYSMYGLSVLTQRLWYPVSVRDLAFLLFMMLSPLVFELGRKMSHRVDHRGIITDDTYAYRWGTGVTFVAVLSILFVQTLLLLGLAHNKLLGAVSIFAIFLISLLARKHFKFFVEKGKVWTLVYTIVLLLAYSVDRYI